MGAHDFLTTVRAESAAKAYKAAVENAVYDYGHDPYNGTISTTRGFALIPLNGGETVDDWADRVIDDKRVRKWEDCACVEDPDEPGVWHFAGWAAS